MHYLRMWLWFKVTIPLSLRTAIDERKKEYCFECVYVQTKESTDGIIQGIKEGVVAAEKFLLTFYSMVVLVSLRLERHAFFRFGVVLPSLKASQMPNHLEGLG